MTGGNESIHVGLCKRIDPGSAPFGTLVDWAANGIITIGEAA